MSPFRYSLIQHNHHSAASAIRCFTKRTHHHSPQPAAAIKTVLQALLALGSAGTDSYVGASWLEDLPAEDASTLHSCNTAMSAVVMARTLVAEAFEQEGRLDSAIKWAQVSEE